MIAPLIHKLSHYHDITDDEKRFLQDTMGQSFFVERGEDIITQGQRPDHVYLIEDGWACRYKALEDGTHHIMAYLIPGDLCDIHITILDRMDHSIRALTPVRVNPLPAERITYLLEHHHRLARALFWSTLVDEATLREWLVNMGTRSAEKRLAHMFCEMLTRTRMAGLSQDDSFAFPLTQTEVGETMGLTVVHVNRVLQTLRQKGLVSLENRRLTVLDWEGLSQLAQFDPLYLHCQKPLR